MRKKSRFLTNYERKQRIEVILKLKGWTWTQLAKEMNMYPATVHNTFKCEPYDTRDVMMKSIKRLANALEVSIGFLMDREEEEEKGKT